MLFIYCEGQTEALFVRNVLNPSFLHPQGKAAAPIVAQGLRPFSRTQTDLLNLLRNPSAKVTTCIDYYGMPAGYPGMPHQRPPAGNPVLVYQDILRLERALAAAINNPRFIPYYSLHEFEALAFADPAAIDAQQKRVSSGSVIPQVTQMLALAQGNPELVNDSQPTSPSHRLAALWPRGQYQKTIDSVGMVQRIPLATMRARCQHFDHWLSQL